jgi:Smg protein
MKETALDVLMYLFENYLDGEYSDTANQETLRSELTGAGFPIEEVNHAFAWLDGLAEQRQAPAPSTGSRALRLYTHDECARLSAECRGFLLYLEQLGLLSMPARELVIDRLMALKEEVDLERLKWVVLLVLLNEPGADEAFGHLEEMVYYEGDFLH